LTRPGLWSAISGISVRAGRISDAGLCSPFFNFHFGGAETGSLELDAVFGGAFAGLEFVQDGFGAFEEDFVLHPIPCGTTSESEKHSKTAIDVSAG
jgi:hypothetical protein